MTDQEIRALYNKFEKKDMPFEEFKNRFRAAISPSKMQEDLMNIQMQKAVERTNRIRIDRAIKNNTGE